MILKIGQRLAKLRAHQLISASAVCAAALSSWKINWQMAGRNCCNSIALRHWASVTLSLGSTSIPIVYYWALLTHWLMPSVTYWMSIVCSGILSPRFFSFLLQLCTFGHSMFFGVATEYLFINAPDDANITSRGVTTAGDRGDASPVRPTMSPYIKVTTDISLSSELTFDEWRGVITAYN